MNFIYGNGKETRPREESEIGIREKLYPNCDMTIWLRSCTREIREPLQGSVTGVIPTWLDGCLIRNGPGQLQVGDSHFRHLFDCSALLHRFAIKNGSVTYQNRYLQSTTYRKNFSAQRIVVTEFGTESVPDPCQTIFQKVSAFFQRNKNESDNAMISVYPFGDEYFAMTEYPVIHRINPADLTTKERVNLREKLGIVNHTSHPHVLNDGTVYNLGLVVHKTGPRYCILQFPSTTDKSHFENARIVASIPTRWRLYPCYMHTFGITDNFFVIVEQPLSVSVPSKIKNFFLNRPLVESLQWYSDAKTIIYLICRASGHVRHKFVTDSLFYLHIINQYEDNGNVILDICCYKNPSVLNCMYIDALKNGQQNPNYATMFRGRPLRFVMPIKNFDTKANTKKRHKTTAEGLLVEPSLLCDLGCETPRINYERHLGKKYRYFYAISSDVDLINPGMLIKVDVKKKAKKTWCEANVFPSEPIFVAKPNSTAEDDGIILSALIWGNGRDNQVGLLVLDAKTWKEIGRAVFVTDGPVPKCLHGWYINNKNRSE